MSTSHFVNIDQMGIDKVEIDKVGRYPEEEQHKSEVLCLRTLGTMIIGYYRQLYNDFVIIPCSYSHCEVRIVAKSLFWWLIKY